MSKALLHCQRADGFWNVSLHSPATYGGPEMTGTALFLYGMSWGIRHGLLAAASYRPACDKAWRALMTCVHSDGFLGWNQGTGKDPSAGQPLSYDKMPDFEDYGTGCWLLGATEYARMMQPELNACLPFVLPEAISTHCTVPVSVPWRLHLSMVYKAMRPTNCPISLPNGCAPCCSPSARRRPTAWRWT